jgi:hypothetical protein
MGDMVERRFSTQPRPNCDIQVQSLEGRISTESSHLSAARPLDGATAPRKQLRLILGEPYDPAEDPVSEVAPGAATCT